MMRKRSRCLIALLLAFCLAAGSAASVYAGGFEGYAPLEHGPLAQYDLQYRGWDDDRFDALLDKITAMGAETPDSEFLDVYHQILDEYDKLYDQYVLADAAYYADVNSVRAAEDSDEMFEKRTDAEDDFFLAMQRVLNGPKGETLRGELTDLWESWIETYVERSDELEKLYQEENRLVQEYYTAISETANISNYVAQAKKQNDLCGPIYLDLVQVRDDIAKWNGYDNYYEYAFDSYGRDYDPEDIEGLCRVAKEELVSLYYDIYDVWFDLDYPENVEDFITQEDVLDTIGEAITQVHPDLEEAWDYLRTYRPYDLEYSETKAATGYTDNLPGSRAAFIFNSPYDTYQDFSDLTHEFGHFNAAFHDPTPGIYMTSILDVAEIHSQALELLVTEYAEDMYGVDAPFMRLDVVFRLMDSVLAGCMYDEFQKTVYENPGMTLEEVNDLAKKLAVAYGLNGSGCEAYEWVAVTHTFDMPCYYVSYATSGISSLDIWRQSLTDWDGATDRYMQVTALDSSTGYLEAVEACGLMDFTDKGAVKQLAGDIRSWFDSEYDGDWSGGSGDLFPGIDLSGLQGKTETAKRVAKTVVTALITVAAIATILVILLILLLWKKHKGEEITNQTPANPGYTEDTSGVSSFYQEIRSNTQSVPPEEEPAENVSEDDVE